MKNLFVIEKPISKYKNICIQPYASKIYIYNFLDFSLDILNESNIFNLYFVLLGNIFKFHIFWTRKTDHAGFGFDVDILGLSFDSQVYDCRHWDDENDKYEEYDEK